MVLGIYFLTATREGMVGEGRVVLARWPRRSWPTTQHQLDLQAPITLRLADVVPPRELGRARRAGSRASRSPSTTTLGRALFNEALPADYPFVDKPVDKKELSAHRQRPRRALPEGRRSPRPWTR